MALSQKRNTFLVVLLVVLGGLWVLKNTLVKMAVIGGAKAVTGLDVQVSGMDIGLLNTAVGIKGLRVGNPAGFPEPVMIDLPEIYVDYRLGSLLKGSPHFDTMRLHLDTLTVVKNAQGQVNLSSIQALKQAPPERPASPAAPKAPAAAPQFRIDTLQLKVGRVVYKDYTRGTPPQVREFAVNIDEEFKNITNPYAFAGIIVSRALMKTTLAQLGGLGDLDLKALQGDMSAALKQSAAELLPTADLMGKKAATTANDAVDGATGAIKKLLGN